MDADFSHDPAALVEMAKRLETCDLVIGSRYIPGWKHRCPLAASGGKRSLPGEISMHATILGMPLRDVTGGFRLWRRETLQAMPLERVKVQRLYFSWSKWLTWLGA